MNKSILVTKRNGEKESINLDKIHKVITWAAEGLDNYYLLLSFFIKFMPFANI